MQKYVKHKNDNFKSLEIKRRQSKLVDTKILNKMKELTAAKK